MPSFSIPPQDRAARRVGTVLAGKYAIDRVLGVGGMASVYAGTHRNGRRVAVKLLHEELGIHSDVRARFVREGYAANAVGHPGVVLVFDDDVAEDGAVFLVMELLEGETLAARCARRGGRLPCREVLALAHQLTSVLAAAHARGIVHRDIKPENLFLTTSGTLKVLDFGIARMRDDAEGGLATATGARIGTPAFMPPEQALGRSAEIDARTDVWAAGATMFALLAGRTVHTASSAAELVVVAATTPPRSLAEFESDLPEAVVAVVDRALQFSRDARFPDARAMQSALEEAALASLGEPLDPADTGPPPEPPPSLPRTEDDRETRPLQRPEATTLPAPSSGPSASPAVDASPTRPSGPARAPVPPKTEPTLPPKTNPTLAPSTSTLGKGLSPRPSEQPPAPAPVSTNRKPSWLILSVFATAAALLGALWAGGSGRPDDPPAGSGAPAGPTASAAASGPKCSVNADCKGASPAVCRREDGACVPLTTDRCEILASPGDVENDATVWIGAMFPTSAIDSTTYGRKAADAVELARRDFAETGGLPPARPGGPRRPIGVVLCDDSEDAERVAAHLVKEVRVPAVLGFARSKEVMDLATSLFLPNRVLALAANTASALRDIPPLPGGPRLVWRVTTSSDMLVPVTAAVLSDIVEPAVRAQPGMLTRGEEMRVAVVRVANPSGRSLADNLAGALRFNGKSVAENGPRFLQVEMKDSLVEDEAEAVRVAERLAAFRPHVILPGGNADDLVASVERLWPAGERFRPRYLNATVAVAPSLLSRVKEHPELRRRYYAFDASSSSELVTRFVLRHNEVFSPPITAEDAIVPPYDAFYVFAHAAAAVGDGPLTGEALARAIARLLPGPGADPVDVGPGDIYRAQYALAAGRNIDLRGVMTSLDFDPRTGDATVDFALYCLTPGSAAAAPRPVESGVHFRAHARGLEGTARCP